MGNVPLTPKQEEKPVTNVANSSYDLSMDIVIGIKTIDGRHDFKLQGDLNAPFSLILFALNNVTDSLNNLAKTKDPEVLHKMTLKDAITPKAQGDQKEDKAPV